MAKKKVEQNIETVVDVDIMNVEKIHEFSLHGNHDNPDENNLSPKKRGTRHRYVWNAQFRVHEIIESKNDEGTDERRDSNLHD